MAVFMSHGVSLQTWRDHGILDREVAIYQALSKHHDIALVVPDRDGNVPNLTVLPNRWGLSPWLYSLVAPVIHRSYLVKCTVYRGHNGRSLWTPLIAWLLSRRAQLVLRFGYVWSRDMISRGVHPLKLIFVLVMECLALKAASRVIVTRPEQSEYVRVIHGVS